MLSISIAYLIVILQPSFSTIGVAWNSLFCPLFYLYWTKIPIFVQYNAI